MKNKAVFKIQGKLSIDPTPRLGEEYVDTVTGFTGTVVSKTQYLDGTTASCLQSRGDERSFGQSATIDDKRLVPKGNNDVYR